MRNLRIALAAGAVALPFALGGCAAEPSAPAAGEAAVESASPRDPIVGTYELVGRNSKDDNGEWVPIPDVNSLGYITYSDRGYMAVNVMPLDREPFADDGAPTPEEAQAALAGYAGYFGPFSVHEDEDGGYLIHHRVGQIDPGGEVDAKRYYDLVGDQLVLTPASATGMKRDATRQVVWRRLPDVPLSDEAQRFLGHRQLLYTDRYVERDGEIVERSERNEDRAGSVILYTPTGHMMVHLLPREERTPYAGDSPTPEEALATYRAYGGYFGRFTVHEDADPPYVVHHQEGRTRPTSGVTDAERLYALDGDVLRLGGRPRENEDGDLAGGHLYWELLPHRED